MFSLIFRTLVDIGDTFNLRECGVTNSEKRLNMKQYPELMSHLGP